MVTSVVRTEGIRKLLYNVKVYNCMTHRFSAIVHEAQPQEIFLWVIVGSLGSGGGLGWAAFGRGSTWSGLGLSPLLGHLGWSSFLGIPEMRNENINQKPNQIKRSSEWICNVHDKFESFQLNVEKEFDRVVVDG